MLFEKISKQKIRILTVVAIVAAALFLPRSSEAACVAAAGQEAWPVFYTSSNAVYCGDGTNWSTVATGGSPAGSVAGAVQFRGSSSVFLADDSNLIWNNTAKSLGIGTAAPAASAVLDLTSTAKGFLPPRMTSAQRDLIGAPATGLTIFNTTNSQPEFYNGTSWNGIGSMTAGTISAFAASSCPSGWTEYTAARGRFLRGIDNGAGNDPDGTRAAGAVQADMLGSHTHTATGSTTANRQTNAVNAAPGSSYGVYNGAATVSVTVDAAGGVETRPKNVAVIFCQFTGSGNVPTTATVTGTTNYVAKFTGAQAVGNSQIFDNGTNVGIGTSAPTAALDVNGGINIIQATGTMSNGIGLSTGNSAQTYTYTNSQGAYRLNHYGMTVLPVSGSAETYLSGFGGISLMTGGFNRLYVAANGNTGIGTTAPGATLDVYKTSPTFAFPQTSGTGKGGTSTILALGGGDVSMNFGIHQNGESWIQTQRISDNSNNFSIDINPNGGNVGIGKTTPTYTLHVNGSVAGTAAYVNTSDKRLKKNIEPLSYGLAEVRRLHPVVFQWKDQQPDWAKGRKLGLIAQEVEPIVPEVVSTAHDKIGTKSIAYGDLTPILIHAIQELAADNDNLRTELEDLRREVHASQGGN